MKFFFEASAFALAFATQALAGVVFSVDFENRTEGQYTNTMAKEDFPSKAGESSWYAMEMNDGQNAKIVQDSDEHGMVLQLKYPEGCLGPNDDSDAGTPACAGQIRQPLQVSADEMWVAYDVQFETGFEFVSGGKLPGLCGGKCYTGGNRPSVGDGWSARIMWRKEGAVVQYLYFVDQASTYGDDAKWDLDGTIDQKHFEPGTWHHVVTRVVLNSVTTEGTGDKNGKVQSWFDGELSLSLDTLRLRDSISQKIDKFYLSTFHGGSNTSWSPSKDVYARFDNFVVSTDSIAVKPDDTSETTAIRPIPYRNRHKEQDPNPSRKTRTYNLLGQQL